MRAQLVVKLTAPALAESPAATPQIDLRDSKNVAPKTLRGFLRPRTRFAARARLNTRAEIHDTWRLHPRFIGAEGKLLNADPNACICILDPAASKENSTVEQRIRSGSEKAVCTENPLDQNGYGSAVTRRNFFLQGSEWPRRNDGPGMVNFNSQDVWTEIDFFLIVQYCLVIATRQIRA